MEYISQEYADIVCSAACNNIHTNYKNLRALRRQSVKCNTQCLAELAMSNKLALLSLHLPPPAGPLIFSATSYYATRSAVDRHKDRQSSINELQSDLHLQINRSIYAIELLSEYYTSRVSNVCNLHDIPLRRGNGQVTVDRTQLTWDYLIVDNSYRLQNDEEAA